MFKIQSHVLKYKNWKIVHSRNFKNWSIYLQPFRALFSFVQLLFIYLRFLNYLLEFEISLLAIIKVPFVQKKDLFYFWKVSNFQSLIYLFALIIVMIDFKLFPSQKALEGVQLSECLSWAPWASAKPYVSVLGSTTTFTSIFLFILLPRKKKDFGEHKRRFLFLRIF